MTQRTAVSGLPKHGEQRAGRLTGLFAGLLSTFCGCSDCSAERPAAKRRPHVLLICMDTVRADRLGCYGYRRNDTSPHLDRLAEDSTVFVDASATEGWTKPSVASFLTGTYPAQHGVYTGSGRGAAGDTTDVLPDECVTLAEVFAKADYRTAAFIHNEHLTKGNGFEQGFDHYQDDVGDARDIRWRALDWLDENTDGRPVFLYLHFLDAHYPYPVPEGYATMFTGGGDVSVYRTENWRGLRDAINDGDHILSASDLATLGNLYDGAIRYIDDQLGMLFDGLKLRGLWDSTIVCVLADHGEEFLEHGRIGHGHGLYENLLRVPWILRIPGQSAGRIDTHVSLVNLFPSLLSAIGLDSPTPMEGTPCLSAPAVSRPVFAEHKEPLEYVQSFRRGANKVVRRVTWERRKREAPILAELMPPGTRWEVELGSTVNGLPRATEIRPRSEEPPSDPVEIKGRVGNRSNSDMVVAGIAVRFSSKTEFRGEIAEGADGTALLREGCPIKVEGRFAEDVFVAERIKFYPTDQDPDPVIRGRIEQVEGTAEDGRFRIDRMWIRVDRKTDWLVDDLDLARDTIAREEVAYLLQHGIGKAGEAGYRVATSLYDLTADPGECRAVEATSVPDPLIEELDAYGARLLEHRSYSREDKAPLSEHALRKLRALGYVD